MLRPCRWMVWLRLLPCLMLILHAATTHTNGFVGVQVVTPIGSGSGSNSNHRKKRRIKWVTSNWIPTDRSQRSSLCQYSNNDSDDRSATDQIFSPNKATSANKDDDTLRERNDSSNRVNEGRKHYPPQNQQRRHYSNHPSQRHHNNNNNGRNSFKSNNNRSSSSSNNSINNAHRVLNQALVKAESTTAVLQLLQQQATLQHVAAGQSLNSVNFSTALHRLARHVIADPNETRQARAQTLSDPRTALLLASIAEGMLEKPQTFQARELANMAWALAKLKLPPPLSALPRSENVIAEDSEDTNNSLASSSQLRHAAATVRSIVMDVARERAQQQKDGSSASSTAANRWIPALSQLSGYLLDYMGEMVLQRAAVATAAGDEAASPTNKQPPRLLFQMQEWSNLLWAWSTAGRANDAVFRVVIRNMIQQQSEKLSQDTHGLTGNNDDGKAKALRPQEWSNAIWAVATAQCYEGHDELLSYVAQLLEDDPNFVKDFKSQELANTVWGVATLLSNKRQQQQPQQQQQPARSHDATLSDVEQQSALTILRYILQETVQRNAVGYRTQELSNTLWAAATLGFGLSTAATSTSISAEPKQSRLNNYVVLNSLQSAADTALMVQVMNVIAAASIQQLPRFWSQELNNLAWALARLLSGDVGNSNGAASIIAVARTNVEPLLRGIGLQLADPRRAVKSQDVGTTLWALANLEYCDESMYRAIAKRIIPNDAHFYKPQELSNSVWAFATTEVQVENMDVFDTSLVPGLQQPTWPNDPVTVCFALAAQELMRRPQQFKAQEIKDVLWAFSKVGIRHPTLFKSVARHLVGGADGTNRRGFDEFSAQGLGNMAWAYARQGQLAENTSERLNLNSGNGRLLVYRTIYFDIGEQLLQQLFGAIAEASLRVHDELRKFKPQDISNAAWAFATLGLKETRYMEAAKDALLVRIARYLAGERNFMTRFKGQELANLLWAFATLNLSPGKSLESLAPYLRAWCEESNGKVAALSISKQLKRQELANMAWAFAVYGNYPEDLMSFLYTGLLGPPGEMDPAYMQTIHKDSGLQSQAVMTLVYAQAEMQMRGYCQNLSLPDDFPNGWIRSSSDRSLLEDHVTDDSFELSLSTSKIQRAVSAAFSRIGFEHVEEYTIKMADMAQEYGVRVPSNPMEVLSIDVANVGEKIAIEIDGPSHYVCRIESNGVGRSGSDTIGYSKMINGKLEYQFRWTGEQQEVNGPTALKERLLKSFGWKVVHLPFWEWSALGGEAQAEEEYCANLLRNVD